MTDRERTFQRRVDAVERDWLANPRWAGISRDYTASDVVRLQGSVTPEHTLAARGAGEAVDHAPGR